MFINMHLTLGIRTGNYMFYCGYLDPFFFFFCSITIRPSGFYRCLTKHLAVRHLYGCSVRNNTRAVLMTCNGLKDGHGAQLWWK